MADYLADKYYPFRNMISQKEANQPTLMEEAYRRKQLEEMSKTTENPRLAEDTVSTSSDELEKAAQILNSGLGLSEPVEVVRPVGELAEKYVGIKKTIDSLREAIAKHVEEANITADQLERHYGMRVPKLASSVATTSVQTEKYELDPPTDGTPHISPVQTVSVAQIRADAQMGGGDEHSFQNSIGASLQSALRAIK